MPSQDDPALSPLSEELHLYLPPGSYSVFDSRDETRAATEDSQWNAVTSPPRSTVPPPIDQSSYQAAQTLSQPELHPVIARSTPTFSHLHPSVAHGGMVPNASVPYGTGSIANSSQSHPSADNIDYSPTIEVAEPPKGLFSEEDITESFSYVDTAGFRQKLFGDCLWPTDTIFSSSCVIAVWDIDGTAETLPSLNLARVVSGDSCDACRVPLIINRQAPHPPNSEISRQNGTWVHGDEYCRTLAWSVPNSNVDSLARWESMHLLSITCDNPRCDVTCPTLECMSLLRGKERYHIRKLPQGFATCRVMTAYPAYYDAVDAVESVARV